MKKFRIISNIFIQKMEINNIKKIKFLLGCITIRKNLDNYSGDLKVLGMRILNWRSEFLTVKYSIQFPEIPLCKVYITRNLVKKIEKYIPEKYDALYFGSRSGEFFLLMYHLEEIIKKYNLNHEKLLILSPVKYHANILSLFYPDIEIKILPSLYGRLNRNIENKVFKLKKGRTLVMPILFNHFTSLEKKIHEGENIHFYDYLLKNNQLSDINMKLPAVNDEIIASVNDKIKLMNLKKKFVILSLGSVSNEGLNGKFCFKLISLLKELGYDIYFNSLVNDEITQYGKTCYMSHSEMFYLTQKAEAVVALRSGFMDVITSQSKKTICFYTDFKPRTVLKSMSANLVLKGFTLKKIPNVKPENIHEYIYTKDNENMIIKDIKKILG